MFLINSLKQEIARSQRIIANANETSKEFKMSCNELDNKHNFKKITRTLDRWSFVRKAIIRRFVAELTEANQNFEEGALNLHKRLAIQRFLREHRIHLEKKVNA